MVAYSVAVKVAEIHNPIIIIGYVQSDEGRLWGKEAVSFLILHPVVAIKQALVEKRVLYMALGIPGEGSATIKTMDIPAAM